MLHVRALILCASGNTDGFTYHMCEKFASSAEEAGHTAEIVDLSEVLVEDCTGCGACKTGNGCVLRDDMTQLYRVLGCIDLLVLATPIRFSGPSSIMKRFIDRLNPFWFSDMAHPKYACALMCGGSKEPKFSNARSEMVSASNTVGMEWLGECCIPDTDSNGVFDSDISIFAGKVFTAMTE